MKVFISSTSEDLKAHLEKHRIDKTILVQAAPTVAETDFLLDLAQRHDFVAGVVGWRYLGRKVGMSAEKQRRSIAVLGVRNLGHPEDQWMSMTLSETLTTELAAGEQLRTVPGENVARMESKMKLPETDSLGEETPLFQQFLAVVGSLDDFCLYTYGSYEAAFLRRMIKESGRDELSA